MHIQVRQDHIDRGVCYRPNGCPIALAIQEELGDTDGSYHVQVLGSYVSIDFMHDWSWRKFALPQIAEVFIVAFDHKMPVEPFEFDI